MNIKKFLPDSIKEMHDAMKRLRPFAKRTCPICGYKGYFKNFGRPPRIDALCPSCNSLERHRLFWLWYSENSSQIKGPILHFAPEAVLERKFRAKYSGQKDLYKTADITDTCDIEINIEQINLANESFSTVICNHVLEHVDDHKALSEIHRILTANGVLIASTPIVEGWNTTYEDSSITDPSERDLHFGQSDHIRFYGSDFRERILKAGFIFHEVTAEGKDVITYSLLRGEKFFICRKKSIDVTLYGKSNP